VYLLSSLDTPFSVSLLPLFDSWDRNHVMFSYHLQDKICYMTARRVELEWSMGSSALGKNSRQEWYEVRSSIQLFSSYNKPETE